jgi:hypothetical protein
VDLDGEPAGRRFGDGSGDGRGATDGMVIEGEAGRMVMGGIKGEAGRDFCAGGRVDGRLGCGSGLYSEMRVLGSKLARRVAGSWCVYASRKLKEGRVNAGQEGSTSGRSTGGHKVVKEGQRGSKKAKERQRRPKRVKKRGQKRVKEGQQWVKQGQTRVKRGSKEGQKRV